MPAGLTKRDTMFSVRETPWHRLGSVLKTYPKSIDEALDKSGLLFGVRQVDVQVVLRDEWTDDHGIVHPAITVAAPGYKANIRVDQGVELDACTPDDVLGVVSDDYRVFDNRDAFRFLDALIGSDLRFETAGSIRGGKQVWVLARLPEWIELGGDQSGIFVYVHTAHDGSAAASSAVTPIRIVCQNTLGAALRRSDHGVNAQRVYRIRHTGNLSVKVAEARQVMGMTINYQQQFKTVADKLATQRISAKRFQTTVLDKLFSVRDDAGKIAKTNRERTIATILDTFTGHGPAGDTTGNASGSRWCAYNAVAEFCDYGRRSMEGTSQVQRSFDDRRSEQIKQRALDLIVA